MIVTVKKNNYAETWLSKQYRYMQHKELVGDRSGGVLLEKLTGFQVVKKFPAFYATQSFITSFISSCHLSGG